MKKIIILTILILSLSLTFNHYTDFGFSLNSDVLIILWITFYSIVLPISLIMCVFYRKKNFLELSQISFISLILYLITTLLSGINFIDFQRLMILGDWATRYVISAIFLLCFFTSLLSFFLFRLKIKRQQ